MTNYTLNTDTLEDLRSAVKTISDEVVWLYAKVKKRDYPHLNTITGMLNDLRNIADLIESGHTQSDIPIVTDLNELAQLLIKRKRESDAKWKEAINESAARQ